MFVSSIPVHDLGYSCFYLTPMFSHLNFFLYFILIYLGRMGLIGVWQKAVEKKNLVRETLLELLYPEYEIHSNFKNKPIFFFFQLVVGMLKIVLKCREALVRNGMLVRYQFLSMNLRFDSFAIENSLTEFFLAYTLTYKLIALNKKYFLWTLFYIPQRYGSYIASFNGNGIFHREKQHIFDDFHKKQC